MTTETQFHTMARDLVAVLWRIWGRDKFNAYWEREIVALRGKVILNYKSLYIYLKVEHDELQGLYDQIFRKQYFDEIERQHEEIQYGKAVMTEEGLP